MKSFKILFVVIILTTGCNKSSTYKTPAPPAAGNYQETNLVADTAGFNAAHIDPSLLNAWGIAINPMGIVWLSSNHGGATNVYDSTGKTLLGPVAIPSQGNHFGGSPSGVVLNNTADFIIPASQNTAKFIFANEDGTISA
ncbi:MAG TPA: hypothetical protein VFI33_03305, partial [Puia sp.]|nr:hypothetical protein [Puia sp.]